VLRMCVRTQRSIFHGRPPGNDGGDGMPLEEAASAPLLVRAPPWEGGDEGALEWSGMRLWVELIQEPARHGCGYAVPTDAALAALCALSPLLEVGAGAGYWAALLRARGADVLATDVAPPDGDTLSNPFFARAVRGGGVERCDARAAAAAHPERALMLAYPYADAFHSAPGDEGWDAAALNAYTGDVVAYIGDARGPRLDWGAADNTSPAFHVALSCGFERVAALALPAWPREEPQLSIWVRKGSAAARKGLAARREGVCAAGGGCGCEQCGAQRADGRTCALPACGSRAAGGSAPLKKCAACRAEAYCCGEHQRADWARHKPGCKAAAAAAAAAPAEDGRN
jgi:hypothetical protein